MEELEFSDEMCNGFYGNSASPKDASYHPYQVTPPQSVVFPKPNRPRYNKHYSDIYNFEAEGGYPMKGADKNLLSHEYNLLSMQSISSPVSPMNSDFQYPSSSCLPTHCVSSSTYESQRSSDSGCKVVGNLTKQSPSSSTMMMGKESPSSSSSKTQSWAGPGRRTRRKEVKTCGVCGDKALSFNFDAVSCESCKAFFRRNASKGVKAFKCPYEDRCFITTVSRRFCKRCRLRTCFEIGMKKEYILTVDERAKKRQQIDQNKLIRKLEERGWVSKDLLPSDIAERHLLTEMEIDTIDHLKNAYESSVQVHIDHRKGDRQKPSMMDLINLAEISVRRVIEMAKKIPNFTHLSQANQISLLKGGAIELLILRGIISYNPNIDQILESGDNENKDSMSMNDLVCGAGEEAAGGFMQLAHSLLGDLRCNSTVLLLLLVICLFSDRPSLTTDGRNHVDRVQLEYALLLEKLLMTIMPCHEAKRFFPLILGKLSDLRELNQVFSKQAMELANNDDMIPLMNEMLSGDTAKPATDVHSDKLSSKMGDTYAPLSPISPTNMNHPNVDIKNEPRVEFNF